MISAARQVQFGPPLRREALHLAIGPRRGSLQRRFAGACFALMLAAAIALPAFTVAGIQLRALVPVGMLALFGILYTEDMWLVLRRLALLLALIGGLALEGGFVSIVNGTPFPSVIQAVVSVHVQAAAILVAAGTVAQVSGQRNAVLAIVAVIGLSALVATLQMAGVEAAWGLRAALGRLQKQPLSELEFFLHQRPMGLSYSPVQMATHLTLALGAFAAFRDRESRAESGKSISDPVIVLALLVFFAACVATATRSPILGGVALLAIYAAIHRKSWLSVAVLICAVLLYFGWPLLIEALQSTSPRVTSIDDNSAAARWVFAYYGARLFLDNPLGYGLVFEPYQLWSRYWSDLYMMRAAQGAQENELHNYFLSILNFYGIGLLLFVPMMVRLFRNAGPALLFFIPYIIHILFHNSGPLDNDTIIWFVVAALSATSIRLASTAPGQQRNANAAPPSAGPALAPRARLRWPVAGAGAAGGKPRSGLL